MGAESVRAELLRWRTPWSTLKARGWWIDAHPPAEAFVVMTAPTTAQVDAILWRYIGSAHRKAER
jgi:hypothetical protein